MKGQMKINMVLHNKLLHLKLCWYYSLQQIEYKAKGLGSSERGNFRCHNLQKSFRIINVNPMAGLGKDMNGNLSPSSINFPTGEVLKPLNHISIPPVTVLRSHNCYLHPFRWVLQKRPIICLPERVHLTTSENKMNDVSVL